MASDSEEKGLLKKYEPLADSLGNLAIAWGGLEATISVLLGIMIKIPFPAAKTIVGNISSLQDKLTILKQYGFIIKHDDVWYEELLTCANSIQGLSEERNRMVHDLWTASDSPGAMHRSTLKPSFADHTRKDKRQIIHKKSEIKIDDIYGLAIRVGDASFTLSKLLAGLEEHRASQQK